MTSTAIPVFQNGFYVGNNFNAILYGMELVLYFMTVRVVLDRKHKHAPSDKWFLIFSTACLCLNTVFVATEAVFGEEMWIVNADYPGGMDAYLNDFASVWYQTFGTAASITLNLLADGLMIYRAYVVWDDIRVIIFPCFLYFASLCLGVAQLIEAGVPHGNYFLGIAQKLGVAYTSCIISLNIINTSLVAGRVYVVGKRYAAAMGSDVGAAYTGAVSIMIESSALSTLTGIAYLVSFAINSELNIFFLSIYVMCTCLAPQLIVLRVMSGRAWTREKSSMVGTKLEFTGRSTTQIGAESSVDHEKKQAPRRAETNLTSVASKGSSEHVFEEV
ncbi:uncharacterized protein BXZ73DRAFT_100853 [Epithele typhae]|uniref:uncharacterized protein n=1 Tax=Epithele typhae TaxID=378194 RepID=UPI00200743FE|nr:uncharacterized protein BXZ73DRAFT_100853 [Epithele typhae]KAH9934013.1 hypothetical protein BXZ73DRAFT_100853 [Epithele typhae]